MSRFLFNHRVEILVVGVLLALLIVVMIPKFWRAQGVGRNVAMQQDMHEFIKAIRVYELGHLQHIAQVVLSGVTHEKKPTWRVETQHEIVEMKGAFFSRPIFATGLFHQEAVARNYPDVGSGQHTELSRSAPVPKPFYLVPGSRSISGVYLFGRREIRQMNQPGTHHFIPGFSWNYINPPGRFPLFLGIAKGPYVDLAVSKSPSTRGPGRLTMNSPRFVPYDPTNGIKSHGYTVVEYDEP